MPLFKSSREVLLNTELAKTPFWFLMILHEKVLSAAAAVKVAALVYLSGFKFDAKAKTCSGSSRQAHALAVGGPS